MTAAAREPRDESTDTGGDTEAPPVSVLPTAGESDVTSRVLRDVMGRFATGITILTAHGEKAHGMTANAFSSLSLDPPMVLCCVAHTARMHDAILGAGGFGVSVLGTEQESVARYFANKNRPMGMAQFDEVDWFEGPRTGVPLLAGSHAWLECHLAQAYEGGDHSIFVGTVVSATHGTGSALLFLGGTFHHVDEQQPRSA